MKELAPIGGPGLRILFVGINPSLRSGESGHHFAGPSNRFWSTLHAAGFTPQRLRPEEDGQLPQYGIGLTNLVARATRAASEVGTEELRAGAEALTGLVAAWAPRLVVVVGVTAYRVAFARPRATMGLQPEQIAGVPVWVLPNPSGLNAHYTPADFAQAYAEARSYAESLGSEHERGRRSPKSSPGDHPKSVIPPLPAPADLHPRNADRLELA